MRCKFSLLLFVLFCANNFVLAQETETTVERPATPVTTLATPLTPAASASNFVLKEGEIQLTGKVTGVNVPRLAISIFADSFTVPNGNSKVIDPPRPKSITLTEPAHIFTPPNLLQHRQAQSYP